MKLYAGNLPYDLTEGELKEKFSAFGEVTSVSIIIDRDSNRPKGFGFVEMPSKSEAEAAIAGLSGKTFKERAMVVNEARPRTENKSNFNGGRSAGYGGFGGGNRRDDNRPDRDNRKRY